MLRSLCLLFFCAGLVACSGPTVDPLSLPLNPPDLETAQFPPSESELVHRPRMLLTLVASAKEDLSPAQTGESLAFLAESLAKYGDFAPIPESKVKALLAREDQRGFRPESIAMALNLGSLLGAEFVAQVELSLAPVKRSDAPYKTQGKITLFHQASGRMVFLEPWVYDSADPTESRTRLKPKIQAAFPLRGFVLETRGDRRVAKISLGASLDLKVGQKVSFRSRIVETSLQNGLNSQLITYSPQVQCQGEVILVTANHAWVLIKPKDQEKLKKGDVVFTEPENSGSFF